PAPVAESVTTEAAAGATQDSGSGETALALYRPSPNPFERTTHFAYEISTAAAAAVDIGVFDLSGRRFRSLVRGTQTAGRYEVAWDGRGDDGAFSRHGIYFLRAIVGPEHHVAR